MTKTAEKPYPLGVAHTYRYIARIREYPPTPGVVTICNIVYDDVLCTELTAARLAQLGERRSAEREVVSSNPSRTHTQGLKITEEKVLSL